MTSITSYWQTFSHHITVQSWRKQACTCTNWIVMCNKTCCKNVKFRKNAKNAKSSRSVSHMYVFWLLLLLYVTLHFCHLLIVKVVQLLLRSIQHEVQWLPFFISLTWNNQTHLHMIDKWQMPVVYSWAVRAKYEKTMWKLQHLKVSAVTESLRSKTTSPALNLWHHGSSH